MSRKSCVSLMALLIPIVSVGCVPDTTLQEDSSGLGGVGNGGNSGNTGGHPNTGGRTSTQAFGGSASTGGSGAIADDTSTGGTSPVSTDTGIDDVTGGAGSGAGGAATGGTPASTATGGTLSGTSTSATGGNATGGTTAIPGTGGTTTVPVTGGTSSVPTSTGGSATGGASVETGGAISTTATGGTSTSETTSTGGTTSAPTGGSSATGGTSNVTTTTTSACSGPLPAPTGLQASNATSDMKIALQWASVPCADKYEVTRATDPAGTFASLGPVLVNAYDDLAAQDTISYYYKVRAYSNASGYGPYSDVATGSRKQGYDLVTSWGSSGSGDGQFASPYNIAFDSSSNVYVLDTYNHRVQKFDISGNLLTKWGGITLSSEAGKFYYPKAITVAGNYVYVGDDGGHVQKFGLDGTYVSGFEVSQAVKLDDIDSDSSGNLYVAVYLWAQSTTASKVYKYSPSYTLLTSWGSNGEGVGQFAGEILLAVDPSQSIVYASDSGHSKIDYFTLSGTYANAWGSTGTGDQQFSDPMGVAVDASGAVYVADSGNNRVQKFTVGAGSATLVASFASSGCRALAVDASTGKVAVISMNTPRVSIYQRR